MDYRLYIYAGRHIAKAVDIVAKDDEHAAVLAVAQCGWEGCKRCELWQLDRMVQHVQAPGPTS